MRPHRLLLLILLAAALVAPQTALCAQRVVLVESFTNWSCPYCPATNIVTHQFMTDYGPLLALNLQYHMSWPSATDSFYVAAAADNDAARAFYGVNAVPAIRTDGLDNTTAGSYSSLKAAVDRRLATPSPLEIEAVATLDAGTVTVDAGVKAVGSVPSSGLVVRMAIVEGERHYPYSPGNNTEMDFYCSLSKMLPDYAGTPLSITPGDSLTFQQVTARDPGWLDLYAVVWVQDTATREILQAATTQVVNVDYAFFYGWYEPSDIVPVSTLRSFPSIITNIGLEPDSYDFHITKNLPAEWSSSICVGIDCLPPFVTDFTVDLGPAEQETIYVDIQPLVRAGQGTVTLTATSYMDPTKTWSQTFKIVTNRIPVLLVDDDGGATIETTYQQAIDATGYDYATWDLDSDGKLAAAKLDYFHAVVWLTGLAYPTLDATDRAAVATYLDNTGNLFLTGQDIGWDMFDASSSNASTEAQDWYKTYLGATYARDDTNDMTLTGVAGDVIGDGVNITLNATSQPYPSEINPYGTGVASFLYATSREAAVHNQGAAYKTCYWAFGFEGITLQATRELLMLRILDWMGVNLVSVEEEQPSSVPPFLASAPVASPNPFNPATHIRFEVGGTRAADVEVAVYDVRGRRVTTVWKGPLGPGAHDVVWSGRSDSGRALASGIYLARVNVNGSGRSTKMVMAK